MASAEQKPTEGERFYGARWLTEEAPDREFPASGMSATDAMRLVGEELALEGDPRATWRPSSRPGWSPRPSG